jgi:hypothetical protein
VPRLLKDVPGQPTADELRGDCYRARFVILFDREGYSPEFFKEMWQTHWIACISYYKYPGENWPTAEFSEVEVTMPNGEQVSMQLAEHGTWVGNRKDGLWMREVRKLTTSPDISHAFYGITHKRALVRRGAPRWHSGRSSHTSPLPPSRGSTENCSSDWSASFDDRSSLYPG